MQAMMRDSTASGNLNDASTADSVLSLSMVPLQRGEEISVTPISVHFAISDKQDKPTVFDPHDDCWKSRLSKGDYRTTNELFNRLEDARVGGKTLRLN